MEKVRKVEMVLKNIHDGYEYRVKSEEYEGGIRIFAVANQTGAKDFVMHYHTLEELNDDWEDAE